jgi:hypothetical protein
MSVTISQGIPTWFIDKVRDDVEHACQQKKSIIEGAVTVVPIAGVEALGFNQMAKKEMVAKEGRNPATPRNDANTDRRWCFHSPYHYAEQFDKDDNLEMQLSPAGECVPAVRWARNRKVDDIVLAAFDATVYAGRQSDTRTITWAAERGDTKYTRATTALEGRTIAHDTSTGNASASDTGMTVEKAELVREYFARMDVPADEPIFGLINPIQGTDLWGQEEYVNNDYNTDKPLAAGMILKYWMGINWLVSTKVVIGSSNDIDADTNVYKNWFWTKAGIKLGVANSFSIDIHPRYDLSMAQEIYADLNMGALRHNEDRVCCVECQ